MDQDIHFINEEINLFKQQLLGLKNKFHSQERLIVDKEYEAIQLRESVERIEAEINREINYK
jgi:hypothetical protein